MRSIVLILMFFSASALSQETDTLFARYKNCLSSLGSVGMKKENLQPTGIEDSLIMKDDSLVGYYLFNRLGAFRSVTSVPVGEGRLGSIPEPSPKSGTVASGTKNETVFNRVLEESIPVLKDGKRLTVTQYTVDITVPDGHGNFFNMGLGGKIEGGLEAAKKAASDYDVNLLTLNFQDDQDPKYWNVLAKFIAMNLSSASFDEKIIPAVSLETYSLRIKDDFEACKKVSNPLLNQAIESFKKRFKTEGASKHHLVESEVGTGTATNASPTSVVRTAK